MRGCLQVWKYPSQLEDPFSDAPLTGGDRGICPAAGSAFWCLALT